ncbi:hexokinase-like isoform X2 [Littorina saxatilis]|uniref:hexokinase-like isoform X2 n=1 Tax=Littorina saxatilis TaxID=31220 RepID=UPI0038B4898F
MGLACLLCITLPLLMIALSDTKSTWRHITCDAGSFPPGQPAAVTCNLHTPVSALKRTVSVVRYRSNAPTLDIEGSGGATTTMIHLQTGTGEQSHVSVLIIGIILIVVAVVVLAATGVHYFRKKSSAKQKMKKKEKRDEHTDAVSMLQQIPTRNEHEQVLGEGEALIQQECDGPNEKEILKGFEMNNEACQEVMSLLQREIEANVGKDASATIKMFSTLVKDLPRGEENGQFMVVNLGSRSLRILFVRIEGPQIETHDSKTYTIPPDVRLGTCVQLLNFLENRLSMFVTSKQLTDKETSVGVVFSFPCKYAEEGDLTTARPKKWTKGFNCDKVVGKDFGKLLHEKLKNKLTTCKLTIKVIINDAAGLLIAGIHKDKACRISFVIGKGVNGCYMKDNGSDGTVQGHGDEKTIIATEWGALGENECLEKFRTDFDRTAVNFSMSPKEQILEKMVGRLYIGEIVRQVLLLLTKESHLFKPFYSELPALNEKRGFTTENVLIIDSDMDQEYLTTRDLLQHLEFDNISDEDCKLVKFVCRIVLQRAAFFAAAALATLVKHVQQSHVTVAIDGSLWRSHLRFKQQMMAKTKELVGPDFDVTFLSIIDGSEIGAALTTAL